MSKHTEHFLPLLKLLAPIVPAKHRNNAAIIGAASLAIPVPEALPAVK